MTNLGKIILNIIENKTPCVFVSPHLDDAIFSAGGLILELSGKTDVFVFTVFTEVASEKSTFSAKNFLRLCGYKKAKDLFFERRTEDENILDTIGVESVHLGFEDAAWRKKTKVGKFTSILGKIFPEFISIYPFFKTGIVSGVISPHDGGLKDKIKEKLISEIGEKISEDFLIFCPVGIGGHVDHLITREVCEELYPDLIFWSDYPYNITKLNDVRKTEAILKSSDFDKLEINPDKEIKKKIILSYKTQAKSMFDNDPVVVPEIFYVLKNKIKKNFIKNEIKIKKPTVSIGIPTYNEEANIKKLLTVVLGQKQDNFELLEIIVVSDGSTDNTATEVKSVASEIISIINQCERKGKTESQNEVLKIFKGDILILLDADIIPQDKLFISNLVKPFLMNSNIGLVSGKVIPLPSENFFEKVINLSAMMKMEIAESINEGDNIYACHGRNRAFSRCFAEKFKWPATIAEDSYSYLVCKEKGFDFCYQPEAEILYRSPQTFADHLRQSIRFAHSQDSLNKFFNRKILKESYRIPKTILIKKTLKYFFKNPILFLSYLFIYFTAEIFSKFKEETGVVWEMSQTSKILTNKL